MKRIQTSIQERESMKEDTREEGPRHFWDMKRLTWLEQNVHAEG